MSIVHLIPISSSLFVQDHDQAMSLKVRVVDHSLLEVVAASIAQLRVALHDLEVVDDLDPNNL